MTMDRVIDKKKLGPLRLAIYGLGTIIVVLLGFWGIKTISRPTIKIDAQRLTIATVKSGAFQEFIAVVGSVLPYNTVYLDATEGGRVEKIFVQAGARVTKGDPILKLSNTNLLMTHLNNSAQINRASNELRATRLQLERNKLDLEKQRLEADYFLTRIKRKFERNQQLFKEELISKQKFDELKDEYEYQKKRRLLTIEGQKKDLKFQEQQVVHLEKSVTQMQSNLEILKEQLENLTLKAPTSGLLTSLIAEVGQSKSQGQRLGQIDELTGFKVRCNIEEHYINQLENGQKAQYEAAGKIYPLKVTRIYPEVKASRFSVDLEFSNTEPAGIRRGQSLHLRLQLSSVSTTLLLPNGGFYRSSGGNWIFVLNASRKTAAKRTIRLGRQNPDYFEVLEGLKEGEQVVTSSYENFGDVEQLILN